jgi:hypothetical protein
MNEKNLENEKKTGKTLRLRSYRSNISNPELSIDRDWSYIGDSKQDMSKRVAITFIDRKYELVSENNSQLISEAIPMRTEFMGKTLLEDLSPYFCYTKMEYCYNGVEKRHTYRVPVEEYITIIDTNNTYTKKNKMIECQGKYYDPEKVYIINDNFNQQGEKWKKKSSIVEFCDKYMEHSFSRNGPIINLGSCGINYYLRKPSYWVKEESAVGIISEYCYDRESHFISMSHQDLNYDHWNCDYYNNCKLTDENEITISTKHSYINRFNMTKDEEKKIKQEEIIIDTKTIKSLTHIGVLPEEILTSSFPLFENGKRRASIEYVVNTRQQAWVDSFQIWHKLKKSDKWSYLGQYGCTNNYNDIHLIDLTSEFNSENGLKFRYFKIVIGSFHVAPILRLELYGKPDPQTIEKRAKTSEDKKFVEYTVSEFSEGNVPDKFNWNHRYISTTSRTTKKNQNRFNHKIDMLTDNFSENYDVDDGYNYDDNNVDDDENKDEEEYNEENNK